MAKAGLNGWTKWVIVLASTLLAIGGIYKTICDMEPEVKANTEHRIKFEEKVTNMETNIGLILEEVRKK